MQRLQGRVENNEGGKEKKGLPEAKVESSKSEAIMRIRIELFFWFE